MTEQHGEGQQHAADRIRAATTMQEILDTAASFEKTAMDFYTALAPKVSKRIRWLVEELAEEEKQHFEMFSELAGQPDLDDQFKALIIVPEADKRFSDCIQMPDLGEAPDDQAVLQYALGREQAAMEQYRELSETAAAGPIQALFEFLANEETKHKAELEKLYYEIVHSGGV